jgi:murein DD-endopeptidase MepM/ murein hydrolase activator NlpD
MRLKLVVPTESSQTNGLAWAAGVVAVSVLLLVAVMVASHDRQLAAQPAPSVAGASCPVPDLPAPWPLSLASEAARTVEGTFRYGSNLAAVLREAGLSATLTDEVIRAAQPVFNLQRIRAGKPYRIYFDRKNEMILLRYQPDTQTAMLVARGVDGWQATQITIPFEIRPRFIQTEIHGSLEGSLSRTRLGRKGAIEVSQKIADIFAWDVDFAADIRAGDQIDLLLEERFIEDEFMGYGDVLAAEMEIRAQIIGAVRYEDENDLIAYYTPGGASIRRTFLRSPVRYQRISSKFTSRRYHPILKVNRPHYGVDYVAPPGTPVQATADGTVSFVGSNSQAGLHVKIRHGGSYTSWYLHLSRFPEGLHVGQQVSQGETIGFVGKTGLASGYHLDYRLSRNGQFVDPLLVQFPAAEPVPPQDFDSFAVQRDRWMQMLRDGQSRSALILAGGGAGGGS